MVVILSLVPMVRLPPPEDPPSPLSSLLPPQADSASAAAVMPAVATSVRRPLLDTEYIRYLVLMRGGQRAREGRTSAAACGQWRCMTNTRFPRCEKGGRGRDRVVTPLGSRCDRPAQKCPPPPSLPRLPDPPKLPPPPCRPPPPKPPPKLPPWPPPPTPPPPKPPPPKPPREPPSRIP